MSGIQPKRTSFCWDRGNVTYLKIWAECIRHCECMLPSRCQLAASFSICSEYMIFSCFGVFFCFCSFIGVSLIVCVILS